MPKMKCPNCNSSLIQKEGVKKMCAQIGNPEIAIVESKDPLFCDDCNDYYLTTENLAEAIKQIKSMDNPDKKNIIKTGIYC